MKRINLIFRRLWRNRLFAFLNILGLAIGISACWIVFRIVNYEFSYDKGHPDKDKIFRLYSVSERDGQSNMFDGVHIPVASYIKENIADVELVAPIYNYYFNKIQAQGQQDNEKQITNHEQIIGTYKDYFQMVPYKWLVGNKEYVFRTPHEVVLTESRAKLYFPDLSLQNILGKTVFYDSVGYTISGVIKDLEKTSSFTAKEFMPLSKEDLKSENWAGMTSNHKLFVKLNSKTAGQNLISLLSKKVNEMNSELNAKYNVRSGFGLTALDDLHFERHIHGSVDKKILYGLIGIGSFLLLLACINYINLSTAQVPFRAKEIGIRKTLGEQPTNVLISFLTETFIISCFALLASWPLIRLFEKFFNSYLPSGIDNYSDTIPVAIFLTLLLTVLTLASSFYPAYLINKVQIAEVIKMKSTGKLKLGSIPLRKTLIIFQFVIAQIFVISTVLMGFQIQFMLNKDLGFNHNGIITLDLPYIPDRKTDNSPELLKEALGKYKEIQSVSLGHKPMSGEYFGNSISMATDTGVVNIQSAIKFGDDRYLDLYNFKLLSGRNLALIDSSSGIILTRTAIETLGIKTPEDAIGQTLTVGEKTRAIVGVISDFNNMTLHNGFEALSILTSDKRDDLRVINIKLSRNTDEWKQAIFNIENEWRKIYPKNVIEYRFFDDQMKELYESDYRFSNIINLSSGITILLSCLGLIGLVTINIHQRTKEIGIRKVLGSSVSKVVRLLSSEYLKLIFISILIASPIAWWGINKWLISFAFRIELSWWMFAIPAVATLIIAFLTMFYHSFKAAKANPVDSLRDE
ncbi:FtsX-like permease family protein [Sphingobacterium shayense]|uniref:ABC transporter permease n=1 Tax=Sphingobacterium shayense TaxID=626343 RepID=UPI001555BB22|nr:ABC transporter permease [Sphingobacterium shayense]NQD70394.1 FtsX-like permease family protein [Sphingobacterium shayense]